MDAKDQLVVRPVQIIWRRKDTVLLRNGPKKDERVVLSRIATPVPGMKLVAGKQGNRIWVDEKAAELAVRRTVKRKLLVGDLFKHTLLTPTQLAKVLKKVNIELADELVTRKKTSVNLVADDAKGDALPGTSVYANWVKK